MATQYSLTNSFTAITEESGTIQNIGYESVELVSTSNAVAGEGIILLPGEKKAFKGAIKARSLGATNTVNVVDFKEGVGGGDDVMTGASASADGKAGLVPTPTAGNESRFLRGDGTWAVPTDEDTQYQPATTLTDGLMSSEDKTFVDCEKEQYRQSSTTYAAGQIAYHSALPTGWYLECTTAGISGAGDLTISSPSVNQTITDGTVTWTVHNKSQIPLNNLPKVVGDYNNYTSPGVYNVYNDVPAGDVTPANASPVNFGILIVDNSGFLTQTVADVINNHFYTRTSNGTVWTSWQRIINEAGWNASAAMHNSIYRGADLTSYWNSGQMSADIQAGNFSNIYPGDYIIKSVTIDGTTYDNVKWIVMDLDYHLHCGDTETTAHHVVLMPEGMFGGAQMNTDHTTAGGYAGSAMFTTHIPKVDAGIEAAFGSAHVLSHRELLSNSMDANLASMAGVGWQGAANSWAWYDAKSNLANETMVYGGKALSSSFFDVGECKQQLAAFRLNHGLTCSARTWWWLRSVASSSDFCDCVGDGAADGYAAADWGGVRPYFLLR